MSKVAIFAKLTAAEGRGDELRDTLAEVAMPNAATEDGTEVYAMHQDSADGDVIWFYELYSDGDALAAHAGSDGMKAMIGAIGHLMAGPAEVHVVNPIVAKGLELG
ncbi:MAG TPA: antibiotic biosynthesis monooxygenase [Acidimicrobiales bacterium]|nr:antibiotic biosynthesis monooxygenase [Acidimicrobiales bacterium]